MDIHEILYRKWGYKSFRPLQEEIIHSVLDGNNTLALLPTGGGKSVCYQVPALAKPGLCIVVTPLIALMKDQVDRLNNMDIRALAIHAGMSYRAIDIALDNCIYGDYKFLYVSPERLHTELFQARVPQMKLNLIAIDEAHCISQWGYDFRPSYLKITEAFSEIEDVPIVALTATANNAVKQDIATLLNIQEEQVFQSSFVRKNLSFLVRTPDNKRQKLLEALNKTRGSAIVYVRSRKGVKDLADWLLRMGIKADHYHAGLDIDTRTRKQQMWMTGSTQVMVCTNAFGMGIDKGDVRLVAHWDMPENLESYYQEAGRAGRDGKHAYAMLLTNAAEQEAFEQAMEDIYPSLNEIKAYYNAICNYLQVAVNTGEGIAYPFDLVAFCETFKLPVNKVVKVLQLLEQQEIITISDAVFAPARVRFAVNKADLYSFQIANKKFDAIIHTLLRLYSGIFEEAVTVKEKDLATRLNSNIIDVRKQLAYLNQMQIIEYTRSNRDPYVTFIQNRVNTDHLQVNAGFVQQRKQLLEHERQSMLDYARNVTKCRMQFVCGYFDETETGPCGICDVCKESGEGRNETIYNAVLQLLTDDEWELHEIIQTLPQFESGQIISALRLLMDQKRIEESKPGIFCLKP